MSDLEVALIIILVLGVILSNLVVLKYSAKFKLPQFGAPKANKKTQDENQQQATEKSDMSDKEK